MNGKRGQLEFDDDDDSPGQKEGRKEHKLGFKEQNKKTNHSAKPIVLLFIRNEDD